MIASPVRRLNDRIRKLCALASRATEASFAEILWDLQAVLHEHATKTCEMTIMQAARRRHGTVRKTSDGSTIH